MRIAGKSILIFSLLTGLFIIFPAINAYAGCNATRFVIEDEVSGQELGVIYTESPTTANLNEEICLRGTFNDINYQYIYRCDKTNRYDFVKKLKEHREKGCKWGAIH